MQTFFVIEADTDMHSLFAYRLEYTPTPDDFKTFRRKIGADADVQELDPSKFFGKLNSMLPTRESVRSAPNMELVASESEAPNVA